MFNVTALMLVRVSNWSQVGAQLLQGLEVVQGHSRGIILQFSRFFTFMFAAGDQELGEASSVTRFVYF